MQISIEKIIEANMTPREKFRKYFKNKKLRINIFNNLMLRKLHYSTDTGKPRVQGEVLQIEDYRATGMEITTPSGKIIWLVSEPDENGDRVGASLPFMFDQHMKGNIEIEYL